MVGSLILRSAFKAWQERHRIVGFFPSFALPRPLHQRSLVSSCPTPASSTPWSPRACCSMHSDYLQSCTCTLQQVRASPGVTCDV